MLYRNNICQVQYLHIDIFILAPLIGISINFLLREVSSESEVADRLKLSDWIFSSTLIDVLAAGKLVMSVLGRKKYLMMLINHFVSLCLLCVVQASRNMAMYTFLIICDMCLVAYLGRRNLLHRLCPLNLHIL